jgi:hypothetical protein
VPCVLLLACCGQLSNASLCVCAFYRFPTLRIDREQILRFNCFVTQVTIEFKPLLTRRCLTGDFPILVNSRAIGGVLRVCLRTRPVLDPDRYEGLPWEPSDGAPVPLSISTYKKGLSFSFPNETNSNNNPSIESIKRESASSSVSTEGTN